jgi:RHS repeat-associated protein
MQNQSWVDLRYEYDGLGRLEKVISPEATRQEEFRYDALGRLIFSSRHGTHEYLDPAHVHGVTQTTTGSVRQYDTNGNIERLTDPGTRDLRIQWTHDDRPEAIHDLSRGTTIGFSYDANGQRIMKRHSASGRTFYYGSLVEVSERYGLVKYYYAGNQLIARRDVNGVAYYHHDLKGSPRLATDASGNMANQYDYSAYGVPIFERETVANDISFHGARVDDESGLVYMNARYYDPTLAQFISSDSIVPNVTDPQSLNRYAYVQNDPINYSDPSGHMPASWRVQLKKEIEARGRGYGSFNYMCGGPFGYQVDSCGAYDSRDPMFVTTWLGKTEKEQRDEFYAQVYKYLDTVRRNGEILSFRDPASGEWILTSAGSDIWRQHTLLIEQAHFAAEQADFAKEQEDFVRWNAERGEGTALEVADSAMLASIVPSPYIGKPNVLTDAALDFTLKPLEIYRDFHDARVQGHHRFPGEVNSATRHETVSYEMTLKHGRFLTWTFGFINEVQGFLWHDLPDLQGRLSGHSPWAFQLRDLDDNFRGIMRARPFGEPGDKEVQRKRLERRGW